MRRALLIAPALVLGAAALGLEEFYRFTFCREGSPLLNRLLDKKGHEADYYEKRDAAAERLRRRPQERMSLRSARGEKLAGFYFPMRGEGKRIAFIVHGYRSEHAETAGLYADYYESRGFDLFCCDHTAHGESEGRLIGFDLFEAADCLLWIEALRRRFGEDVQIVLHGFSMGAATVMKMSADCPGNVKLIVADCGYADAQRQLAGQFGPLYPPLRLLHRLIAGVDLRDGDVRPSLRRSRIPILIVHGRLDKTVPFENAPELFACARSEKDCLYVENARHVESMYAAPEAYAARLDAMIGKTVRTE
ncbi:MAG: lysophospholipase [Oscillospiraceae bacterium]|nr:lysophospholipase [Oscillospiraceae bacterium]